MNRQEFIKKVFSMFPSSFSEANSRIWIEGYEAVLREDLDFKKLFLIMLKEYNSTCYVPAPSWFAPYIPNVEPPKKAQSVIQKELWENEEHCPPPPNVVEMMNEIRNRKKLKTPLFGGRYD